MRPGTADRAWLSFLQVLSQKPGPVVFQDLFCFYARTLSLSELPGDFQILFLLAVQVFLPCLPLGNLFVQDPQNAREGILKNLSFRLCPRQLLWPGLPFLSHGLQLVDTLLKEATFLRQLRRFLLHRRQILFQLLKGLCQTGTFSVPVRVFFDFLDRSLQVFFCQLRRL